MPGVVEVVAGRPRHAVLAALVLGLLLGPRIPVAAVAAAAAVVLVAASAVPWATVTVVLVTAAVGVGGYLGDVRVRALDRTALGPFVGHVVRGEVTVVQAPRGQRRGGWTALASYRGEPVLLRVNGPSSFGGASAPDSRPPPRPPTGAVVAVRAAVAAPDDYATVLRAHAVLRLLDVRATGRHRGGAAGGVDALRRGAMRRLAHGPSAVRTALLQGMVLGQDAGLPTTTRDEVRASGLSHLTAASGANIVLLCTLVIALSGLIGVPFRVRWLVVLALIAVYVPLAGAGPSIQRAGIMGAAGVVAMLAGRPSARWYAVGLAACVTLLLDPRAAGDPGWQMSFAAVIALVTLARPWAQRLAERGVPGPLAEALAVTAAASLATAPIIAAHFGRVAPLSVPANLVVAPVVAPVMWLGFTASTAGAIVPRLGAVLDVLVDPLLRWVVAVAHATAGGPGAGLTVAPPVVLAGCMCAVVAAGVVGPVSVRVRGGRPVPVSRVAALVGILLVAVVWALRPPGVPPPPPVQRFRVTFLDVGQGDATLLQVPGHAVLVDTGPPDDPLLARLAHAGVRRLDVLSISHAQADHDGAASAVLSRMPVGLVLDGQDGVRSAIGGRIDAAARIHRVRRIPGRAGMVLRLGTLTLTVLSPDDGPSAGETGDDPNNRAIVIRASVGNATVLLTADAESDVLSRLDLGPVDVLKVSHHGSADPGLPRLLRTLRPVVAGIEVGAHNTYGHPVPATVRALRAVVPRVVRTDRDGSVRVDLGPAGWTVTPHG